MNLVIGTTYIVNSSVYSSHNMYSSVCNKCDVTACPLIDNLFQNVMDIDSAPFSRKKHYRSDFRTDLRLSSDQSAKCIYFKGITKGHMVPAGIL